MQRDVFARPFITVSLNKPPLLSIFGYIIADIHSNPFKDSLFLANCEVMDYSLVVGVSENEASLRVGIIDFIRTFTRGKRLESLFKEAVGGGMEAPTIIDPKQYRTRFLNFLDSVLLLSPDHWLSPEEEARSLALLQHH